MPFYADKCSVGAISQPLHRRHEEMHSFVRRTATSTTFLLGLKVPLLYPKHGQPRDWKATFYYYSLLHSMLLFYRDPSFRSRQSKSPSICHGLSISIVTDRTAREFYNLMLESIPVVLSRHINHFATTVNFTYTVACARFRSEQMNQKVFPIPAGYTRERVTAK